MSIPQSLRAGSTVDKRLIFEIDTAPSADPTPSDLGWSISGADWLHVYFELTGGANVASVTPWYWSSIAGQWFEGDTLSITSSDKFGLLEIRGEEKVFFVVDSIGGPGGVKCWAAISFDGR